MIRSGLGFPGEAEGILENAEDWQGTERYTVAYGQGVAVTAVQLAAAMNTIANGGTYVSPRLVRSTIGRDGQEAPAPASESHEVLSRPVADEMNQILREVVCRGTGKRAQIDGYTVAGKTGTSYKARDSGGYVDAAGRKKYYASFAGFVPAESPGSPSWCRSTSRRARVTTTAGWSPRRSSSTWRGRRCAACRSRRRPVAAPAMSLPINRDGWAAEHDGDGTGGWTDARGAARGSAATVRSPSRG